MALDWNVIQGRSTNAKKKATSSLDWDKIQGRVKAESQQTTNAISSGPTNTPQVKAPTISNDIKLNTYAGDVATPEYIKSVKENSTKNNFYNTIVKPTNTFMNNATYGAGEILAKPIVKYVGGTATNLAKVLTGKQTYTTDEMQQITDNAFSGLRNKLNKGDTASNAGETIGKTAGYLGTAAAFGGGPVAYALTSGLQAAGNTNDVGDIAFQTGKGFVFGKLNKLIGGGTNKLLNKVPGATTNLGLNITKNTLSGATGMWGAGATTGEVENIYNLLRDRDVTKEDWLKPVWSSEALTTAIIGGVMGAYNGTKADLAIAKNQLSNDYNKLGTELSQKSIKIRNALRNGDLQTAQKLAEEGQNAINNFANGKYLGLKVNQDGVNTLNNLWTEAMNINANYYNPNMIGSQDVQMNVPTVQKLPQPQTGISTVETVVPPSNVIPSMQGIATEQNSLYNANRGEINGEDQRGRVNIGNDETSGLFAKTQHEQEAKYTREQYERFEQSIKPIEQSKLTIGENETVNKYKDIYKKNIDFFEEDGEYGGGASTIDPNKIYINRRHANEFGTDRIGTHEVLESDINHDKLTRQLATKIINEIANDMNFVEQKELFWNGQGDSMPSDVQIAKDILCDAFSKRQNNEQLDYKNILSEDTNNSITKFLNMYVEMKGYGQGLENSSSSFLPEISATEEPQEYYGKIDFLGNDGKVGETLYYTDKKAFENEIKESVDCGRPIQANKKGSNNDISKLYMQTGQFSLEDNQNDPILNKSVQEQANVPSTENIKHISSRATQYESKKTTAFINKIVDVLDTTRIGNTHVLREKVSKIADDIRNKRLDDKKLNQYIDELYEDVIKVDTTYYDENKDIKDMIRNTKLYVSDKIKGDIADYNDYRKNAFGTVNLVNDSAATKIDTFYQELNGLRPDMFPDTLINPSDQLQQIIRVAKDIRKVEHNVGSYLNNEFGPQYKEFVKQQFQRDISAYEVDLKQVDKVRAEEEKKQIQKREREATAKSVTFENITELYNMRQEAKYLSDKITKKELLTKKDKIQVDRLIKEEITFDELPNDVNKGGIKRVYEAKKNLDEYDKEIREIRTAIKESRLYKAEKLIANSDNWKEKNILGGLRYSTETAERNIYDIVPDRAEAAEINKEYFESTHVNEASATRHKNRIIKQIKALDLSEKPKYKVSYPDEKGLLQEHIVSESNLVQLLGEKILDENALKESGADYKKIKKAVDVFRGIYNKLYADANRTLILNGYAPVDYRKDYFPHFTEEKQDTLVKKITGYVGIDTSNQELPTDIAGLSHTFRPGKKWVGNFLQRVGNTTDYDALKGMDKYLGPVMDVIYHTEDIQKLRALEDATRYKYSNNGVQEEIDTVRNNDTLDDIQKNKLLEDLYTRDNTKLSHFATWLRSYTDNLSGKKSIEDRNMEHQLGRSAYNTMKNIEGRVASNMIGANINSALTNFIPLVQGYGEITTKGMLKAMWYTARGTAKSDGFIDRSDFLTNRRSFDRLSKSKLDKVVEVAGALMNVIDEFTSETLVRGKYYDNLDNGMSEEEAMDNANKFAAGVMADRSKGAVPVAFNVKNPVAKLLSLFQLEVNNQYRYVWKDLPNTEAGRATKAQMKFNYAKALVKIFLATWVYGEIKEKLTGYRSATDPVDIVMDGIKDFSSDNVTTAQAIANSTKRIAQEIPFISGLLDGGRIPISSAFPDVENIINASAGMITGEMPTNKATSTLLKELAKPAMYFLLPTGGGQAKKAIEGISTVANGGDYGIDSEGNKTLKFPVDTANMNTAEKIATYIKAGLFGKYSLSTAKDYIDGGFRQLSANKTEIYQKALEKGIPAKTYLDINNDIKKITPDGEKFLTNEKKMKVIEVIESYDLTEEQKKYLYQALYKNEI